MSIEDLQAAVLKWFWCEPERSRSMQQIENRCTGLYEQFFPQLPVKNAKYALFHPLVKYGFIEFSGEGSFTLAPTCGLQANGLVLLINLPAKMQTEMEATFSSLASALGYAVYQSSATLVSFLKEQNIPSRIFDMVQLLQLFPPLTNVVRAWEEETVSDAGNYLFFQNKWISSYGINSLGVYKKSGLSYAQRLCRISEGQWRLIPSAAKNIDAFYYAVLWSKTHTANDLNVNYLADQSKFIIEDRFFPLTLERLLIINTLLHPEGHKEVFRRHYYLDRRQFRILNAFLNNSITVSL